MKVRFLGDVHCDLCFKKRFTKNTIQIGDLCLVDYSKWTFNSGNHFFIDGNHECFPALNPDAKEPYEIVKNLTYIPRGYVSGNVLFIGGAGSIDKRLRLAGRDWFPEEEITQKQVENILNIKKKIEVVVAHDCPYFLLKEIVYKVYENFASSNKALEVIFNRFKPKLWIFGHHHQSIDCEMNGCRFICLNIGESKKIDIPIANNFFDKI